MKKIILFLITCHLTLMGHTQNTMTEIPLYADSIPNSKPAPNTEKSETTADSHILIISNVSRPTLTLFLPARDRANGTAVVICPGGGYGIVAAGHEGYDIARKFNNMGVAAFVLKYRIPNEDWMPNREIGPLQDAQRAIQLVREHAAAWNVNPNRVGIMGFSAGGHLASTAGTHFSKSQINNTGNTSLRPDFMVLIYPVISFTDEVGHIGSRDNLLGKNPSPQKILEYSNEMQVTDHTPASFLVHAGDDEVVKVQNSLRFYEALQQHHIPAEIHVYPKGGHGFGLNNPTTPDQWMERLKNWMDAGGWLKK